MSDGAIATIVSGLVTVTVTVVTFLTLWVKLKYGVRKAEEAAKKASVVESKLDDNTQISKAGAASAKKAEEQTNGVLASYEERMAGHHERITSLELKMIVIQTSVDAMTKNIDSTRHEIRGHLQTLTNKLDIMSIAVKPVEKP